MILHTLAPQVEVPGPCAIVVIYSEGSQEFINTHRELIENSECSILFSNEDSRLAEDICEESGVEFVWERLEEFTEMKRVNGEMVGVARVKEAVECAVAAFVKKPQESREEDREGQGEERREVKVRKVKEEVKEDDMEKDMENFEYFLNKIKDHSDNAMNLDDESRKKYAEETIKELVAYLKISEGDDEDSED